MIKKIILSLVIVSCIGESKAQTAEDLVKQVKMKLDKVNAVSYTHLTLPTKRIV